MKRKRKTQGEQNRAVPTVYIHKRKLKNGKFSYKRKGNGFEHGMVSFWVHKNQKYIQSLGFDSANNRKMLVEAQLQIESEARAVPVVEFGQD